MTRSGFRPALAAALLAAPMLITCAAWLVASPSAQAAGCVTGQVPPVAGAGSPFEVSATASGCAGAKTLTFWVNGNVQLSPSCNLHGGDGTCREFLTEHNAGFYSFTAQLSTGTSYPLGTVDVVSAQETSTAHTTPPPPPPPRTTTVFRPPPTSAHATSTATATASATASATATPTRSAVTYVPNFGAGFASASDTSSAAAAAPSDSSTPTVAPAALGITHGSGSVGLPSSLLWVTIVVLAGVGGAAVRLIYIHTQGTDTAI